jgi:hypothetical protein
MASIVASKRIPLFRLVEQLLAASPAQGAASALRPVAVAGGSRAYNTGAQLRRHERDESDDDSGRGYDTRRPTRDATMPAFFSGSRHLSPCQAHPEFAPIDLIKSLS